MQRRLLAEHLPQRVSHDPARGNGSPVDAARPQARAVEDALRVLGAVVHQVVAHLQAQPGQPRPRLGQQRVVLGGRRRQLGQRLQVRGSGGGDLVTGRRQRRRRSP